MGYTKTDPYEGIIRRHIRSGRASNKTEVVHQALSLLDAATRNRGTVGSSFASAEELEALLLEPGPAHDGGAQGQNLLECETVKWQAAPEVDDDLIEGRDYIRGDNDVAARSFLNTAFEPSTCWATFQKWVRAPAFARRSSAACGSS